MRKKYLSALLFGALLFASAGTFTSCKDYDDDINNLQEQINTINTTLSELKTLVGDGGVSSVTFDESTGVLTVVDANGTKTYTIKTAAGSVDEVKITIEGQELKVNGTTVGKVGDTVAVANGELTINGTATGIKVGEYAILDNQTTGTVTITLPDADGKMQTVELMKDGGLLTAVQFETKDPGFYGFGEFGSSFGRNVLWMKSEKANPNWEGSKGSVEKNQLLIGQIATIDVQVTPANYQLDTQALSLVDSRGNIAPVTIKAVPNVKLMPASRTESASGSWTLYAEIDQAQVNTSNIVSEFDYDDNGEALGYALCVNGKAVTPFDISVNTAFSGVAANYIGQEYFYTETSHFEKNFIYVHDLQYIDKDGRLQKVSNRKGLPVGETKFEIDNPALYDFYLTFEGTNKSKAQQYGFDFTKDKRGIVVPAGAEGVSIDVTVHTMGINGYVAPSTEAGTSVNTVTLTVASSEVASETVKTTNHVINAANPLRVITVDFGGVFAQFPAAAREAVRSGNAVILVEGDTAKDGFFLNADQTWSSSKNLIDYIYDDSSNTGAEKRIKLYEDDWNSWEFGTDDMLDLKYMQLDPSVAGALNPDAVPGEYNLTFRAVEWNGAVMGNELIKVTVPVTVSTPKFTDLFNFRGNWNDAKTEYTTKITIDQDRNPALLLGTAFEKKAEGALTTRIQLMYDLVNNQSPFVDGTEIVTDGTKYITTNADQLMKLNKSVIYNGTTGLKNNNLGVKAYYDLFNAAGLSSAYDNFREAFAVTSDDLTVKLQKALEGITAAYYVNGAATNSVQLLTGNEILAGSGTVGKDANGLFFSFNGDDVAVKYTNWYKVDYDKDSETYSSGAYNAVEIGGYNLALEKGKFQNSTKPTNAGDISVTFVDEKNGLEYDWVGVADGNKSYSENVGVNQWTDNLGSTNVVIKFTDATGMTYQMSPITLIKAKN